MTFPEQLSSGQAAALGVGAVALVDNSTSVG